MPGVNLRSTPGSQDIHAGSFAKCLSFAAQARAVPCPGIRWDLGRASWLGEACVAGAQVDFAGWQWSKRHPFPGGSWFGCLRGNEESTGKRPQRLDDHSRKTRACLDPDAYTAGSDSARIFSIVTRVALSTGRPAYGRYQHRPTAGRPGQQRPPGCYLHAHHPGGDADRRMGRLIGGFADDNRVCVRQGTFVQILVDDGQ